MKTETSSLRRLQPFDGVTHVEDCDAGRAVSLDGELWQVQVGLELEITRWSRFAPAVDARKSVPYYYWSPQHGVVRRLPLNPAVDPRIARELAAEVTDELARVLEGFPFPAGDLFELWLLDGRDRSPLALLASARDRSALKVRSETRWRAFPLHRDPLLPEEDQSVGPGLAGRVESLVNRRGGSTHAVQWFRRLEDGSGQGMGGRHLRPEEEPRRLPAQCFPATLLREDWGTPEETALLVEYGRRLAPRLLALGHLPDELRRRLEGDAWQQPLAVHRLHARYPQILDRDGMQLALVKAQILLSTTRTVA